MQKTTLEIPFRRVRQANLRIDTLCRSIINAGLISGKYRRVDSAHRSGEGSEVCDDRVHPSLPQAEQEDKMELGDLDELKSESFQGTIGKDPPVVQRRELQEDVDEGGIFRNEIKIRKAGQLAERIIDLFPWTKDLVDGLMASDIRTSLDPISEAMVDILDDRLEPEELHSARIGREWKLCDGLASFLRAGVVYIEFNSGLKSACLRSENTRKQRNKELPLLGWYPERLIMANTATILRVHRGVNHLAKTIRNQMGLPQTSCPIRGSESIQRRNGRVRISLEFDVNSRGRRRLAELNSISPGPKFREMVSELAIWKVEILLEAKENNIPMDGYSGYLAMDQIMRKELTVANLHSDLGSMEIVASIRKLVEERRDPARPSWRDIPPDKRRSNETALGVAEEIEKGRAKRTVPWMLDRNKQMEQDLIVGSCARHGFSRWTGGG